MPDRRDDWRSDVDHSIRSQELWNERIEGRLHNAEILANEIRAEFRAVKKELSDKIQKFGDALQSEKVKDLSDRRVERKALWITLIDSWKGITVALIMVFGGIVTKEWDDVKPFLKKHLQRAENTKIPGLIDPSKPKRRHRTKKPAIHTEPAEPELNEGE